MLDSITNTDPDSTRANTDPNMSVLTNTVAYYTCNKIECEKCDGTGYQQDNTGIWHICPICEGGGMMERKEKCVPWCPPCNPWYPIPWEPSITYDTFPPRKYIITC